MKVGIISFAHMHAYSYADGLKQLNVEIAGISDEDEERGKEVAEQYQSTYFANYEDLLNTDMDAVIVTSENIHHITHVTAAAKAGKHILCEKPLATTLEDAQQMIDICKENNVILQTAFPVRFNSSVRRAKEMVESGNLGRVLAMKGKNRGKNPGGWFLDRELSGGGAVLDHTVHVVDIMRWIMCAEVTEVYAEIDNSVKNGPIDDCGIVTMEFDNGVFASLDCSWSRNETYPIWADVKIEFIGSEGTLTVDAFAQKIDVYDTDGLKWDFYGDDMDQQLVADFVQTVLDHEEPSITGEDGLRAIEVALAAYESAEKKRPVKLR